MNARSCGGASAGSPGSAMLMALVSSCLAEQPMAEQAVEGESEEPRDQQRPGDHPADAAAVPLHIMGASGPDDDWHLDDRPHAEHVDDRKAAMIEVADEQAGDRRQQHRAGPDPAELAVQPIAAW